MLNYQLDYHTIRINTKNNYFMLDNYIVESSYVVVIIGGQSKDICHPISKLERVVHLLCIQDTKLEYAHVIVSIIWIKSKVNTTTRP